MRLWSQQLLPYLDRQRLLGQHRECCALRGKGWGKKHATVDYAFMHDFSYLVAYHYLVMDEMTRRGYNHDNNWEDIDYRGLSVPYEKGHTSITLFKLERDASQKGHIIYPEHSDDYLRECINLLKEKNAPIDWEKVEQELCIKV